MKKILFSIICSLTFSLVSIAQLSTQATPGAVNRLTPQLGFNTNGQIPSDVPVVGNSGANWTQQWFIDSTVYLYPEILRFPGGTNSNHWDWQTGWFLPGYQPGGNPLMIRTDEFKPGLQGCNGEGLYVVNMETSNISYEMDGLRHTDSLGMNPTLFELGNEHNLNGVTANTNFPLQLMTSTEYSQLAKTYYDSIKSEFPVSRICAVGGNTSGANGEPGWNDSILNYIPEIEAFAFHVYLTADNADLVFDVNRALAIPFGSVSNSKSLAFRYNKAGFDSLPASKEVWVTEYNLEEFQDTDSILIITNTWTHALYLTGMNNFYLSQPNVNMILIHTLAAAASHYESISKIDKHITANGISMKLLSDVARGSQSCQDMAFSGNPEMIYGNDTIPKLIGWKFNQTGIEKGFICNFSADTINVSLNGMFSNAMQFDQYYGDTSLIINGLSSLNKYSGNSSDSIAIYPFSITHVNSSLGAGIEEQNVNGNNLWIYPNPSNGSINIQANRALVNAEIVIINLKGQEVFRIGNVSGDDIKLKTDQLTSGAYIIHISDGTGILTTRLIVD